MNNLILIPTNFEANFILIETNTIVNTGIGVKTTKLVSSVNKKIDKIVLIGFAGILKNSKIGQAYQINEVCFNDQVIKIDVLDIISLECKTILTVKKPIQSTLRKEKFTKYADLVDMETFFLAKYCRENNIKFYSIRVALDDCENDLIPVFKGTVEIPNYIKEAGKNLNNIYKTILQVL